MKSSSRTAQPPGGRLHRSQLEIDAILRRHQRSGQSLLAFAREHDLCYATLRRWRRRAADQDHAQPSAPPATPAFIPIELEPATVGAEFVLNWAPNRSLRIPPGFDPEELGRLLDLLGVRS